MGTQGTKRPADRARKQSKASASAAERVKVKVKGRAGTATVTVLPVQEWGYAFRDHFASSNFGALIEDIVAEEDWETFNSVRPSVVDVAEFIVAWSEKTGEDVGESLASQAS
jgi:hypothetical protein